MQRRDGGVRVEVMMATESISPPARSRQRSQMAAKAINPPSR